MAGAGNPEVSEVAQKPVTQLLNQGFSALPLGSGVGCPARLSSSEDPWSGSGSSRVSRVGRSFSFWKQRATQVELSSSQWPSAGPLLRAVGPLRVQGRQEGSFSRLPRLLGRAQRNLYRKLSGQGTDFPLGLFGETGWGGNSFTRVLLSSLKKKKCLQTFFLLLEVTTLMVTRLPSPR